MPNEVFSVILVPKARASKITPFGTLLVTQLGARDSSTSYDSADGHAKIEFTTAWRPIETTLLMDMAIRAGIKSFTYAWWETGVLGFGRSRLEDGIIKSRYYSLDKVEYAETREDGTPLGDDDEPVPAGRFARFLKTYFEST